jgi:ABC-type polysaccharide/polyol phosphate export permease
MYFKRGDPVNWVIGASFDLLSGVYFPVAVFPDILKGFSQKLPTTAALDMWRALLLDGAAPGLSQWLVQLAWALVLCGLGILAFRKAYDAIRFKGELGSY